MSDSRTSVCGDGDGGRGEDRYKNKRRSADEKLYKLLYGCGKINTYSNFAGSETALKNYTGVYVSHDAHTLENIFIRHDM